MAHLDVIRLSKSKFLSGLQCHKRLYYEVHAPELATPPDARRQAMLDSGKAVGELARQRFPGGVLIDVDYRRPAEALRQTAAALQDPSVPAIFEGAFEHDGVFVRVDILQRIPPPKSGGTDLYSEAPGAKSANWPPEARLAVSGHLSSEAPAGSGDLWPEARAASEGPWRLIEVKSSTRQKQEHLPDLAVQAEVLAGAGVNLVGCALMRVNTGYVYKGEPLDLEALFAVDDLSAEVAPWRATVPERLGEMKRLLGVSSAPAIEPSDHCWQPHECPFWAHCTKEKPARWVYHLPGGGRLARELASQGIHLIDDIPSTTSLTLPQRRVRDNVEWVGPKLAEALRRVRYPVHHLDFETFMPAVPRFERTRPYQMIPTQWSNHIEAEDRRVHHDEYLCSDPRDPRQELTEALLKSLGTEGSICVYSSYERSIIDQLAESLPDHRTALRALLPRLWDLLEVIKRHYYHPAFNGSYSIKTVLPALVPELAYADLEIQDGATAAQLYERMLFHETDWVEKAKTREALLAYCERDSLAMLEIRRALLNKIG